MSDQMQMWTDGGSRSNPGPAAIGIVLKEGDAVVFESGEFLGHSVSNNHSAIRIADSIINPIVSNCRA